MRGVRGEGGERRGEEADAVPVRARVLLREETPAEGLEAAQADLLFRQKEDKKKGEDGEEEKAMNLIQNCTFREL